MHSFIFYFLLFLVSVPSGLPGSELWLWWTWDKCVVRPNNYSKNKAPHGKHALRFEEFSRSLETAEIYGCPKKRIYIWREGIIVHECIALISCILCLVSYMGLCYLSFMEKYWCRVQIMNNAQYEIMNSENITTSINVFNDNDAMNNKVKDWYWDERYF